MKQAGEGMPASAWGSRFHRAAATRDQKAHAGDLKGNQPAPPLGMTSRILCGSLEGQALSTIIRDGWSWDRQP